MSDQLLNLIIKNQDKTNDKLDELATRLEIRISALETHNAVIAGQVRIVKRAYPIVSAIIAWVVAHLFTPLMMILPR